MSEKKFCRNAQITEQPDGGYVIQWRGTSGRMEHSKAIEKPEQIIELIKKIFEDES